MRRSSPGPLAAVAAVAVILIGACSGATPTAAPGTAAVIATRPPVTPVAAASAGGSATSGPISPSSGASTTSAEPPAASLAAEGGEPVAGQLGSFTWGNGGSDSPWLPGAPLTVGAGETLTMSLADGTGLAVWTARRIPAGSTDGSGAVAVGSGTGAVTFDAPPPGAWSVQVAAGFTGDLGSATWYWLITVR